MSDHVNDGRKGAYGALLAASGLFAASAVATLVPWAGARWPTILGYRALCSFAPISTALCAAAALAVCVIRSRLFGPRRGEERSWKAPLAVALVLAAVIAASAPFYAAAKGKAADAASSASLVQEGGK
jgi:hypothetical protein